MRKLTKAATPAILAANEDKWTAEYLAARGTELEPKRERWRHAQIRMALREETKGKCAYCEGVVDDVSFPHVEHIIPKSVKPELAHRWINLTSACGRCNNAKGAFHSEPDGLLNPYEDALDAHLRFLGSLIHWDLGSQRGEMTVRQLGLNRLELVRARAERLESVRALLDRWHRSDAGLREVLAAALRLDAREGEFSRTVHAYLASFGFPLGDDGDAVAS